MSRSQANQIGLDEYLSKPIKYGELCEVLTRLSGHHDAGASGLPGSPPVPAEPPLDLAAALHYVDGDAELFRELLPIFKEACDEQLHALTPSRRETPRESCERRTP